MSSVAVLCGKNRFPLPMYRPNIVVSDKKSIYLHQFPASLFLSVVLEMLLKKQHPQLLMDDKLLATFIQKVE